MGRNDVCLSVTLMTISCEAAQLSLVNSNDRTPESPKDAPSGKRFQLFLVSESTTLSLLRRKVNKRARKITCVFLSEFL